jgi:hypothetical protein
MPAVSNLRVPTVLAIVVVAVLGTTTLTLAASSTAPLPSPSAAPAAAAPFLVVPDVRRQAYVFAKGALEQGGFAWKVSGPVQGYAANLVAAQAPAPGTRVVADGAPIVTLQLSRNGSYKEQGLPENASPFHGTPVRLVGAKRPTRTLAKQVVTPKPAAAPKPAGATKPDSKPAAKPKPASRKPAFVVSGAPAEPGDEIALTARAKRLRTWLEAHPHRSQRSVNHWLYQHNWIVTGARFGWSDGADSLRVLIQVDRRAQKLWGVGAKSEQVARRALAEVEARSR